MPAGAARPAGRRRSDFDVVDAEFAEVSGKRQQQRPDRAQRRETRRTGRPVVCPLCLAPRTDWYEFMSKRCYYESAGRGPSMPATRN